MINLFASRIKIHPLFWIVIAAGVLTGHFWETAIAFFIVFVHECGHVLTAYWFGWTITEIELLPFGGVAKIDPDEAHPFTEETLVLLAGPFQHVWLPALSWLLIETHFWSLAQHQMFLNQNFALLFFNLLPIWPLDGGRLLHVYLEKSFPYKVAYDKMLFFSIIMLAMFCLIVFRFFPFSVNLWIMCCFILFSLYKEKKALSYRFLQFLLALMQREKLGQRVKKIVVQPDMPVPAVFLRFYKNTDHWILIEGRKGKMIHDRLLISAYFSGKLRGKNVEDCRSLSE
ncbi:stage IV sporulation protein FB [Sporolactobacillus sp. THM7-4]|nr:stage IV sporulation protein FB [Sporolactobacillus sp. THM7-4]